MSDVEINVRGLATGDKPHIDVRIDLGPNQSAIARRILDVLFAEDPKPQDSTEAK